MTETLRTVEAAQRLVDGTPLHRWLGFRVTAVDAEAGTLSIRAPATGNGARFEGADQAHGGAIATLLDTAAAVAVAASLDRPVPTMNLRIDYLRPAGGSDMTAAATIRRLGRTAAVVDVDLTCDGRLAAVGRATIASGA